jgi:hypothetical protein
MIPAGHLASVTRGWEMIQIFRELFLSASLQKHRPMR